MDYIPRKDSEKVIWNNNLIAKIDVEGNVLGLTPAEITEIRAVASNNSTTIIANDDAQTAARVAKAAKDAQLKMGNKVLRAMARKMKSISNYTIAIGTNLGIIGDDPTVDYSTYQPRIKASVMPGRVRIDFVKDGLNGMNLYARLKGQSSWVKLAYDSFSPYEDNRPLSLANTPEHREYMAIGVIRDEEVTLSSDIIEAVYGG
jgi:hypothetical protein